MRRLAILVGVLLLAGMVVAAPALAQDQQFDNVYVDEEPPPVEPDRVVPPAEPVDEPVAVAEPDRPLPVTGMEITVGMLLAAGLVAAGVTLLLLRRRAVRA